MEKEIIVKALETYGGGFAQALGAALARADSDNTRILIDAFSSKYPEYFAGGVFYAEVAEKKTAA